MYSIEENANKHLLTFGHNSVKPGVPRRGQVSLLPRDPSVPPPQAFPIVEQQQIDFG